MVTKSVGDLRWIPRFLREKSVRTGLQAFYVAMVGSSENAQSILECDLGNMQIRPAGGNKLVRSCFVWAVRWFSLLREFSISDEIYTTQLLEPVRCAARFILSVRNLSPSTGKLTALVFKKSSAYYDRYFRDNVLTLSILLPELETALSLRCGQKYLHETLNGMYYVSGVQPVPFINRIHPVHLSLEKSDRGISLSQLNSLKVSLQDVKSFPRSFVLENFCEVESVQFGKRHLGAPFVFVGKVVSVDFPVISFQSFSEPSAVVGMLVTRELMTQIGGEATVRSLRGRTVRGLAVAWYELGYPPGALWYPEIFYIEPTDGPSAVIGDEILGYIRLRGRVRLDDLQACYRNMDLAKSFHSCVVIKDGWAEWSRIMHPQDELAKGFIAEKARIENLRYKLASDGLPGIFVPLERVFDSSKLRLDGLAQRISAEQTLLNCFLELLQRADDSGSLPRRTDELVRMLTRMDLAVSREKLEWLTRMGFLSKVGDETRITKAGHETIYLAIRRHTGALLRELTEGRTRIIDVLELEKVTGMPPSLLVKALKEFEKNGQVKSATVNGQRCELFWIVVTSERVSETIQNEVMRKWKSMVLQILAILGSIPHPLEISKVLERLQEEKSDLNYFSLQVLLFDLQRRGKLQQSEGGKMWFYPWQIRIQDILLENPYHTFAVEELVQRAHIPPIEREAVISILKRLAEDNLAVEILPGKWVAPFSSDGDRRERLRFVLKSECRKYILTMLSRQEAAIQCERLAAAVRIFAINLMNILKYSPGNPRQLCEEVIDEMLTKRELIKKDDAYRVAEVTEE